LNNRFYSLDKNSLIGAQKLQGFVELFSKPDHPDWSEDYLEIFIYEKNQGIMRGSRKVPLIDKPQKPIDMIGTMGKDPVHE
jgi:hypothetical protein